MSSVFFFAPRWYNGTVARADVLLLTVNDNETRAVQIVFLPDREPSPEEIDGRIYYDLGEVNQRRVMLTRSEPGADGAKAAVDKAITSLSPKMVINVGVAAGMNRESQQLGDVLVAAQLRPYEFGRLDKNGTLARSSKPDASTVLLHLFKSAALHWKSAEVQFGCLLSGDKLVRDETFRDSLLKFEPEAIGLEMEGKGVYLACQEKPIAWILVKAISDWADCDKSDVVQHLAARNAATFVDYALRFAPASAPVYNLPRVCLRNATLASVVLVLGIVIGVIICRSCTVHKPQVLLVGGSGTMMATVLPVLQNSQEEACKNIARLMFTNDVGSMHALDGFSVVNLPVIAFMSHRFDPNDVPPKCQAARHCCSRSVSGQGEGGGHREQKKTRLRS